MMEICDGRACLFPANALQMTLQSRSLPLASVARCDRQRVMPTQTAYLGIYVEPHEPQYEPLSLPPHKSQAIQVKLQKLSRLYPNNPSTATALYLQTLLTELFIESSTALQSTSSQIWPLLQYTRPSNAVMEYSQLVSPEVVLLSHHHHKLLVNRPSTSHHSKSRSTAAPLF